MTRKKQIVCQNCGNRTQFNSNADYRREAKQLCYDCWRMWRKERKETAIKASGRDLPIKTYAQRYNFDAPLPDPRKDSPSDTRYIQDIIKSKWD